MRAALLCLLFSVPALAFPVPKGAGDKDLAGTSWKGIDGVSGDTVTTFNFLADGKMTYSYNGATHTDASWKVDGDKITWQVNNNYRMFEATRNGDKLTCKSHNVAGFRNEFSLDKVDTDGK